MNAIFIIIDAKHTFRKSFDPSGKQRYTHAVSMTLRMLSHRLGEAIHSYKFPKNSLTLADGMGAKAEAEPTRARVAAAANFMVVMYVDDLQDDNTLKVWAVNEAWKMRYPFQYRESYARRRFSSKLTVPKIRLRVPDRHGNLSFIGPHDLE
jgi:hypothetical protein